MEKRENCWKMALKAFGIIIIFFITEIKCYCISEAVEMFRTTDDGTVLVVTPPNASESALRCLQGDSNEMPKQIVTTSSLVSGKIMPENIIVVLDKHQNDFDSIKKLPVLKRIIFFTNSEVTPDILSLTGHFPNSLILTTASGRSRGFVCYWRPHFYREFYRIRHHVKECASFQDVEKDFNGHTIRAVAFNFLPYSVPDFENGNHGGFEYEIAASLASSLNLKMSVRPPSVGGWWGSPDPLDKGNGTGLIGDLQSGLADLGWANLFDQDYRRAYMDFTDWYLQDPVCFLVQRPEPKSRLQTLTLPLNGLVWLFGLISIFAMIVFYVLHNRLLNEVISTTILIMHSIAVSLKEQDNFPQAKESKSLRLVHGFFMLYMLVMTAAYSSSLISFLSIEVYPDPPSTYEEVADDVIKRDLNVAVCCHAIKWGLGNSTLDSFQKMQTKVYQPTGWSDGFLRTSGGTDIYLHTRNALEITRRTNTYRVEYDSLHISRECFMPMNYAIGLRRQNPIKDALNWRLLQLKDAGVISKLIKDGNELTANSAMLKTSKSREVNEKVALSLKSLEGIFQICLILIGAGILIFLLELMFHHIRKIMQGRKVTLDY